MSIFKWRWQSQCWYFRIGKLAQSYWDEKLWNYVAFIGGREADLKKNRKDGGGAEKLSKLWGELMDIGGCFFCEAGGKKLQFFSGLPIFPRNINFNKK